VKELRAQSAIDVGQHCFFFFSAKELRKGSGKRKTKQIEAAS
jgi:hypothetical protein